MKWRGTDGREYRVVFRHGVTPGDYDVREFTQAIAEVRIEDQAQRLVPLPPARWAQLPPVGLVHRHSTDQVNHKVARKYALLRLLQAWIPGDKYREDRKLVWEAFRAQVRQ